MPNKQQSILLGGLVAAVLSTSYLGFINLACCLGVMIGAGVGVWHYTTTNRLTISVGTGAGIGALAGLIGAVIAALLNWILAQVGLDASAAITNLIIERFGGQMPPEQVAEMRRQAAEGQTLGGVLSGAAIGAAVSALFGAIGGAIAALIFKKGDADADLEGY